MLAHVHSQVADAALASWWGYAEADSTIVGILVGAVVLFAIVFVAMRAGGKTSGSSDSRREQGKRSRGDSWRS